MGFSCLFVTVKKKNLPFARHDACFKLALTLFLQPPSHSVAENSKTIKKFQTRRMKQYTRVGLCKCIFVPNKRCFIIVNRVGYNNYLLSWSLKRISNTTLSKFIQCCYILLYSNKLKKFSFVQNGYKNYVITKIQEGFSTFKLFI